MALPLANTGEGGTNGTAITAATQTGGASGNAFDAMSLGTSGAMAFDNAHPAHGANMGYKITQPATLTTIYTSWTTSLGTLSTNQTLYGRVYYWASVISGTSIRLFNAYNGTTLLGGLSLASGTNALQWRSSADASVGVNGTNIPINTLVRIEFQMTGIGGGATALGGTANWYTGDSATTANTASTLSGAAGGTLAPNGIRWMAGVASGTASTAFWFDGFQLNATGFPGPEPTGRIVKSFALNQAVKRASSW